MTTPAENSTARKLARWLALLLMLTAIYPFLACRRGEPTAQTETLTDVRLGYLRIGSDLPYFVAEAENLFEEHGLAIRAERMGDSNQMVEAILQGQLDATDIVGSAVVLAAALERPQAFQIFMSSSADADHPIHKIVAHKDAQIEEIADLRGKRLAVFPGSQMRAYARLFLASHLPRSAIETVELVPLSPPQQIDAFLNKDIDAVLTLEPTGTQLIVRHEGKLVLNNVLFESISSPEPFVTAFGLIRRAWADENPQAAAKLISAYRAAAALIQNNPQRAREILAERLDLDPAVAMRVDLYDYPVVPDIPISPIRGTAETMVASGVLSTMPDLEALLYTGR